MSAAYNEVWSLQGMVDAGEAVSVTLKREFGEEALNTLEASPEERKRLAEHISQLFQKGREVLSVTVLSVNCTTQNMTWSKLPSLWTIATLSALTDQL